MRMTLYGFLNYDPTLFDDVVLPDGIEKDYVVNDIIRRSGDLFPYHQALPYLKTNITAWFNRNYLQFERMINALLEEYSPIENYDRHEKSTTTPDTTRTESHSGTIKDAHDGNVTDKDSNKDKRTITNTLGITDTVTSTNEVSAYDSTAYQPNEKTVQETKHDDGQDKSIDLNEYGKETKRTYANSDTRTHNDKITTTDKGKTDFESRIHGNIGVTTAQQMITAELELRKFDIYTDITRRFEKEFLIQVY